MYTFRRALRRCKRQSKFCKLDDLTYHLLDNKHINFHIVTNNVEVEFLFRSQTLLSSDYAWFCKFAS